MGIPDAELSCDSFFFCSPCVYLVVLSEKGFMYRYRLGHILGLEALLVVDIFLEFPAQFACLVGEQNIQSLFGENGATYLNRL